MLTEIWNAINVLFPGLSLRQVMCDLARHLPLGSATAPMHQERVRSVFDRLISKTHVEHALIQPNGQHNDIPPVSIFPIFLPFMAALITS